MRRAGICGAVALAMGCMHLPGGVTDATEPINNRSYIKLGRVTGTDSYVLLLGFLPVKGSNSTREALIAAKREQDADALVEVSVDTYFQWWILFTRQVIRVDGTAIRFIANLPPGAY